MFINDWIHERKVIFMNKDWFWIISKHLKFLYFKAQNTTPQEGNIPLCNGSPMRPLLELKGFLRSDKLWHANFNWASIRRVAVKLWFRYWFTPQWEISLLRGGNLSFEIKIFRIFSNHSESILIHEYNFYFINSVIYKQFLKSLDLFFYFQKFCSNLRHDLLSKNVFTKFSGHSGQVPQRSASCALNIFSSFWT